MSKISNISIRRCTSSDIDTIVQLVQWAYRGGKHGANQWTGEEHLVKGPRTTPGKLQELLSAPNNAIIVCERVDEQGSKVVVGSIHLEKCGTEGHVAMLAVDPDEQASGVGRALMQAAEDEARTTYGCTRLVGEVISGRPELMEWYLRLGYRQTGQTKPFFGPEHGVEPLVEGLHFVLIEKSL